MAIQSITLSIDTAVDPDYVHDLCTAFGYYDEDGQPLPGVNPAQFIKAVTMRFYNEHVMGYRRIEAERAAREAIADVSGSVS